MHTNKPSAAQRNQISRRRFLRGVGVTMALPWLESINVWGAVSDSATAATSASAASTATAASGPKCFRRDVHGQRHQRESLVGQRLGR